jgi:hypothetical protein
MSLPDLLTTDATNEELEALKKLLQAVSGAQPIIDAYLLKFKYEIVPSIPERDDRNDPVSTCIRNLVLVHTVT